MTPTYWLLLFTGVLMSAIGGILLKIGSADIRYDIGITTAAFQILTNWKILFGMLMYFVPVLIWIFLLKRIDISFLQPLFSLIYVITPILAIFILNEHVSSGRWFGISIVLLGVFIITQN